MREVQLRREKVASFDRYPFDLPAVRALTTISLERPVAFFVGYEETEHYQITRDFLNRYPAMLRALLASDASGTAEE